MLNANSEIHRGSLRALVGEAPEGSEAVEVTHGRLPRPRRASRTTQALGMAAGGQAHPMPSPALCPGCAPELPADPIQQRTGPVLIFKTQKTATI